MSNVVVVGGHGKVGLRLSGLLAEAGHSVTSWVRNPDHAAEVEATGATAAVQDVEHLSVDELAAALSGQDVIVWSAGAGGGSPERTYAVDRDAAIRSMEAARSAGVRRYVMVSYFGASQDQHPRTDSFMVYAEAKSAADARLRDSDLDWTILGPSSLTDEPGTGLIEVGPGVSASEVSRDDVAAVAAYVIGSPGTAGRTIEFNNGSTPIADALS